ncbi:hypothetical protein J6590_107685, partial [Homalodisca vitripennis]
RRKYGTSVYLRCPERRIFGTPVHGKKPCGSYLSLLVCGYTTFLNMMVANVLSCLAEHHKIGRQETKEK